jgi:ankyrin repeat protein
MSRPADPRVAFIEAAIWHGPLEPAEAILAAHPEVARADIHTAAILGDDGAVRRFLERNPASVNAKSPPFGGDALNYLCLSKYLRLDPGRTPGFLRAATALLDAGADPNTGFWKSDERETALYGAAGVAHHPEMTRLLLERGADPNDEEVVYHSPETRDNAAMKLVVETGKVRPENLALMLIRKHDWHDHEGARYLLERGVDLNLQRTRGWRPLHHALARDNALQTIELLLDHGADPRLSEDGLTAIALAARGGRSDVLDLLERRGVPLDLTGVDRLIAACARGDAEEVRAIAEREPGLVAELHRLGGELLGRFSATGNLPGVRQLLDLGVGVGTPWAEGDGYFGIPPNSLAIHVAAWCCCTDVARLLIERGSPVELPNAHGDTPLALAVRACVDSYWTEYGSPVLVEALIRAGASAHGVPYPSGHAAVDAVLAAHRGDPSSQR